MLQSRAMLGPRIRAARTEAGFSQEELAELMDVSSTTVRHWEAGHRHIARAKVPKLAAVLKKSVGYFFDEEPLKVTPELKRDPRRGLRAVESRLGKLESKLDQVLDLLHRVAGRLAEPEQPAPIGTQVAGLSGVKVRRIRAEDRDVLLRLAEAERSIHDARSALEASS